MLGAFRATLDTEPPATFRTVKERALLVYLAVEANRPHSREALAALLWPEKSEQVARRNLSTALMRLRNALHDLTTELPFLLITPQTVHLNPQAEIWSDIGALTALFDACDAHHHRHVETCRACFGRLQQAVALYREEFLVGFSPESLPFEEWARTQRETLHRRALDGMQSLARACERRGDYAGMQRAAQRQLALEPWRELAHRQLMRALTLTGQRDAALAQYRSCRQALQKELGVAPDEKTQELFAAIQSGSRLLVESATFNVRFADFKMNIETGVSFGHARRTYHYHRAR